MDTRYTTPEIARLFDPGTRYATWMEVLLAHAQAQAEYGIIPPEAARAIEETVLPWITRGYVSPAQRERINEIESECRHDVVAFLYWLEDLVPDGWGRYLHYGLTSSDLVDTGLGMQFAQSGPMFAKAALDLLRVLEAAAIRHASVPVLAHTHGQPAEPTNMGFIVESWGRAINRTSSRLDADWIGCAIGKLSGPVGTHAHNPPEVAVRALVKLGLRQEGDGSQTTPRDFIARWAASAAQYVEAIAKIGLDFRLMAAKGETSEGGGDATVGSSSMPHKSNPVRAEQLSGMSRLAAGYAAMLQPLQLWEQRDISHSCVERVAIPDLMHVVMHATGSAARLISQAQWDTEAMNRTLLEAGRRPYSAWVALRAVDAGMGRREARETARQWAQEPGHPDSDEQLPPFDWFTRHHVPIAKPSSRLDG